MKLNKTLSLILAIIMVAATFGVIAVPAAAEAGTATTNVDISWYEANKDAITFTISTADQLDGLAYLVNNGVCNFAGKTVKLGADIVYNSGLFSAAADGSPLYNGQPISETNAPRVWPVIGAPAMVTTLADTFDLTLIDKVFNGNFDGCGYEISGLYFDNPTNFRMGLFSVFAGEELKNTIIRNAYFRGNGHVASFIGFADRDDMGGVTLENLYSDATIVTLFNGDIRSAGIIGQTIRILDFVMNRCAYEGNIIDACADNNNRHRYIAGLFARMDQQNEVQRPATITNCLVNATFTVISDKVTNVNRWGGILGDSRRCSMSGLTISDCLVIINTDIPEVTYDAENNPVDFQFKDFGAMIGFTEHQNIITIDDVYAIINGTDVNSDNILKAKIGNAVVNTITYEGTTTEYSEVALTQDLAAKIETPSQATDLDTSIFLLTAEKAAIKDLSACFDSHSFTDLYQDKPASCEGEGWKAHYRCNNCSKFFDTSTNEVAKDTVILPETHNYGTLIAGTPATCTVNGTLSHYKCNLCNGMFNEDKEKVTDLTILAGHNYGELIREVKADCQEAGAIAHYECSVCNKYFDKDMVEVEDITIPVTDHDYGKWVEAVAPTTSAAGVLGHYKCDDCRKYFDADKNELASIEGEPKLTTTKKPDTTKTPTTTQTEEKGCGGFTAVGALLALVALSGAAVVIKKK